MNRPSRSSQSQAASIASAVAPIFHSAGSKRFAKARAQTPPSPSFSSTSVTTSVEATHAYPEEKFGVVGERFPVDFNHIYLDGKQLLASRVGYKVRHKSALLGDKKSSPIWKYGVELEYFRPSETTPTKLWLCRLCHLARETSDAKVVNSTAHITNHIVKVHRIDPATGLLPDVTLRPSFSSPFDAAKAAGSGTIISHMPWQEEALQSALVDWVILKDVSFSNAVSPALRGLLTWNRSSLLPALPNSSTTMRKYILRTLEGRTIEVTQLLASSSSRISISVDVWTSSNYLSFLGVVAHFAGKSDPANQ